MRSVSSSCQKLRPAFITIKCAGSMTRAPTVRSIWRITPAGTHEIISSLCVLVHANNGPWRHSGFDDGGERPIAMVVGAGDVPSRPVHVQDKGSHSGNVVRPARLEQRAACGNPDLFDLCSCSSPEARPRDDRSAKVRMHHGLSELWIAARPLENERDADPLRVPRCFENMRGTTRSIARIFWTLCSTDGTPACRIRNTPFSFACRSSMAASEGSARCAPDQSQVFYRDCRTVIAKAEAAQAARISNEIRHSPEEHLIVELGRDFDSFLNLAELWDLDVLPVLSLSALGPIGKTDIRPGILQQESR